jgi:ATP-dependent protease ClpP protease subunit
MAETHDESQSSSEQPKYFYLIDDIKTEQLVALVEAPEDLPLFVSSPGGCISVARGLVDLVRQSGRRAVATGLCASSALLIFSAAKVRHCTPLTKFVFHEPYIHMENQSYADELEVEAQDLRNLFSWACKWMGKQTRKNSRWWARRGRGSGFMFDSTEAHELGLVHKIVEEGLL